MITEESRISLAGHQLHRLTLKPEGPAKRSLIFFHGQGDFIDRYPTILEAFVKKGVTCILTDLPGHGRSSGKRGHVPGFTFIDRLLEDSLEKISGPVGIAGHSMGGMIALRSLLKNPSRFDFAWMSSPLLDPARQGSPIMRIIIPQLARYFPWITRSTGVRSEHCRADEPSEADAAALYHSKISLGWVRELLLAAAELETSFSSLPLDRPLLFTQGAADPVCPASLLRERLATLPESNVTYLEIPEALHEPFIGENGDLIRRTISDWLG